MCTHPVSYTHLDVYKRQPDNKSIWIGLTTIYGIGRPKSLTILEEIGIDFMTKVKDLTDEQEKKISEALKAVSYTHLDVYKRQS